MAPTYVSIDNLFLLLGFYENATSLHYVDVSKKLIVVLLIATYNGSTIIEWPHCNAH